MLRDPGGKILSEDWYMHIQIARHHSLVPKFSIFNASTELLLVISLFIAWLPEPVKSLRQGEFNDRTVSA